MGTVLINSAFLPLYNIRRRYMVIYGGRRSGKSIAVSQLLVRRALESPKRRIGIVRKVGTTIRLSVWARIEAAIDEAIGLENCTINKADRTIKLPGGSEFVFFGLDDPLKTKSIEGITDYWLEEANEFTENDFDTLDVGMSLERDPILQVWITFNPIPQIKGMEHWLQTRFINKIKHKLSIIAEKGDICVFRTWYKDNVKCPAKTIEILERYKKTNPQLWKMWGLGEFTMLEGVIFNNWDEVEEVPKGIALLGYGLDFGFANDPAAVIEVWKHNKDVWLDEKVYGTGLTNQALSTMMTDVGVQKGYLIVADSAEPKSIKELRELDWKVIGAKKPAGYKMDAIRIIQGLNLHITARSVNLKKEIATYCWPQNKQGNTLAVVPDGNDHAIDASIYRLYNGGTHWSIL